MLSPHEQYLEQYEKVILKDTGDVLSLGLPSLDEPLGYHGLPLDTLFYIYAKSGVGKSYVITNLICKLMEQNRKSVFFSFEMSYRKIMDRILQLLFEKHFSEIPELVKQNSDFVRMRLQEKGFFDLVKIYNRPMSIDEMDKVLAEQKADIYFVDHLHLVKTQYAGVYEKTTHISNGLRDLKSKYNTRIMCLVQLRREGYVKGAEKIEAGAMLPTLEMGRGSGDIEADADVVLGLCRPEVSVNCKEAHKAQLHGLYLKRRDSSRYEPKIIVLHFNRVTSALREEWHAK
jgi:replicative DNA helicase